MTMKKFINNILYIILIQFTVLFGEPNTKVIKNYSIVQNFGTETRELSHSTIVRYNPKNQLLDSTLYIHNVPLSQKYSYIDFKDRRSLQKQEGIERLMHFKYEYNLEGNLVSKKLYGSRNDSLKWKEFYKYFSNGNLWKIIRIDPSKVNVSNKLKGFMDNDDNMPWGESFDYNENGNIKEHKEFYAGFVIEHTIYDVDSSGAIIIKEENYDPSIMKKTTYSYDTKGNITEIIHSRRGYSIGSEKYEYYKGGKINKIMYFNMNGDLEKTVTKLFENDINRETKIITDSTKKLIRRIESRNNSQNKPIIQATFDNKSRLLQKKTIGYDKVGRLSRIHDYDMLKPSEGGKPILINIITYEYD